MFNGKDLTGFYTYLKDSRLEDPQQVFTVADGMIHISGEEWGTITTRNEYADYRLIVEWKWGGKTVCPGLITVLPVEVHLFTSANSAGEQFGSTS